MTKKQLSEIGVVITCGQNHQNTGNVGISTKLNNYRLDLIKMIYSGLIQIAQLIETQLRI